MSNSCRWYRASFYFAASVVLAASAISTAHHYSNVSAAAGSPLDPLITPDLIKNASRALRNSGFHVTATLLQLSPFLFLNPAAADDSSVSTVFAIADATVFNASLSPGLINALFQYHSSPLNLNFRVLMEMPSGACLPTRFQGKNIAVTGVDPRRRKVEINGVRISYPDLFLSGSLIIHGVLGSFTSLDPRDVRDGLGVSIQSPICDADGLMLPEPTRLSKNRLDWSRVIRSLGSNGFVPFAIVLHAVLGDNVEGFENLSGATIFAPRDSVFAAAAAPRLLGRIVRLHMVPRRLSFAELGSLPEKAVLKTLVRGRGVEVTAASGLAPGDVSSSKVVLKINGVEITAPDVVSSRSFVIHGISRPFEVTQLSNSS